MAKEKSFTALVLGAGLGTRMKSSLPKVLHELAGEPLIIHSIKNILPLKPRKITVVVGHKAEMVEDRIRQWADENNTGVKFDFVRQKLLKGSGRAVFEARDRIERKSNVLIVCADAPLLKTNTLLALNKFFLRDKADGVILSSEVENPASYGRIKRDENGNVISIVEESDADEMEEKIKEINSGVYVFKSDYLLKALPKLRAKGPKKEYYLTDIVEETIKMGGKVRALKIEDAVQTMGINSRIQLAGAHKKMYLSKAEKLMLSGVTILDPANTYIENSVKVGKDTVIYPGVFLKGQTVVGQSCKIGPYVVLEDCKVEANVEIKFSCFIVSSVIKRDCVIGPFSHIRPGSDIGPEAKVGNFSEIKKSRIREGSKVPHLSYVGDTEMGRKVNVGAGTITCNYDGVKKHKTVIGDGVFIGSNTNLIAPVKVGNDVLIGAGSTITENIPRGRLAIARARQVVKKLKKRK